jgi:hypothetical protein
MKQIVSVNNLDISIDEDGSFTVKEFSALSGIIAALFYALFIYAVINTAQMKTQSSAFDKMLLMVLIPAIGFTYKARNKTVYIRINKEGIYIGNFFLTSWKHFISAEYTQKKVVASFQDNFILIVHYYREGDGQYVKEVPLTNTQNKAEEEVIAAIQYFYDLYKKEESQTLTVTSIEN